MSLLIIPRAFCQSVHRELKQNGGRSLAATPQGAFDSGGMYLLAKEVRDGHQNLVVNELLRRNKMECLDRQQPPEGELLIRAQGICFLKKNSWF